MSASARAEPRFWAVVPAAGVGRRMGGDTPKQYLALLGRPVIEHTLMRLCTQPRIAGVVVALARDDPWWAEVRLPSGRTPTVVAGGAERCHSVLAGLDALAGHAQAHDWVLVHDAVRPCLRRSDLERLMDTLGKDDVGGLLAIPVKDTMKRANGEGLVSRTVSREGLWHAQTPQMFRLGPLRAALTRLLSEGRTVTDEAQAMELEGAHPRLIEGHEDNIKITRREDMLLAEHYLSRQERDA